MSTPEAPIPLSLDALVHEFTLRLCERIEVATRERGLELIDSIFAAVNAGPGARLARRELQQAMRERRHLLASLTRQFLREVEQTTRARVRKAVAREWAARARAEARASSGAITPRPAPRRVRRRPEPPPPDPQQIERDRETARLRAILRPTSEEWVPLPPALPAAPVPPPARPTTPGELLRALEKEIQNAMPALAALGPDRCGAQIAAWAGQVRQLRDRLAPEVLAIMRAAIRIFLEHLTELRAAMDAHFVDALEPKWSAPDWNVYIEVNRARAEGRPPALATPQLEAYHRAMLRALVQPHRRNVPAQAVPVINAAAAFLPADDGQLRSAIRRHSSEWQAKAHPAATPPADPATAAPSDETSGEELPSEVAEPEAAAPLDEPAAAPAEEDVADAAKGSPLPDSQAGDSEFDQPWTK